MANWNKTLQSARAFFIREKRQMRTLWGAASKKAAGFRGVEWLRSRFVLLERRIAKRTGLPLAGVDERRRAFVKYALFGGAVFLASRYLTPLVNAIRGDTVLSEKTFENFKITETGRQLKVTDDDGGEVLTIDKESF